MLVQSALSNYVKLTSYVQRLRSTFVSPKVSIDLGYTYTLEDALMAISGFSPHRGFKFLMLPCAVDQFFNDRFMNYPYYGF